MRRRTRSSGTADLFAGPAFTARQLTALVLGLLLAVVLVPFGAQAAQVVSAIISDPGGTNQATVDAGGNLHVTSAEGPGRMAVAREWFRAFPDGEAFASASFTVPQGKRLVIQFISAYARLPGEQRLSFVNINTTVNESFEPLRYNLLPVFVTKDSNVGADIGVSVASQEVTIYADGGTNVGIVASRSSNVGLGDVDIALSGYLIDCSGAPCN